MNESPEATIGRHAKVRVIEVASGPDAEWLSELILKRNGEPRVVLANAARALRLAPEWAGVLGFDSFAQATTAISAPPWEKGRNSFAPRSWTPHDDLLTAEWLQHHGVLVGHEVAHLAVELVAQEHTFHPIRDYARRLVRSYVGNRSSITIQEVLGDALHIDKAKWTPAEQTRVSRSLRALGFERKQKREGGERQYEYRRKDVSGEER